MLHYKTLAGLKKREIDRRLFAHYSLSGDPMVAFYDSLGWCFHYSAANKTRAICAADSILDKTK